MSSLPPAVGLKDVAHAAGVSLATASRAMNDAYGVSPATRARVLDAAARLDFVASPEASRLARGRTGRVALVVPHVDRWFFGEVVAGVERVLAGSDLDVLLYQVDGPASRRDFFDRLPARRKVDAVIVVAFPVDDDEHARLQLMGTDIVAAGGQAADYPCVRIDDYLAGRRAVEHLVGLGHRRVAMIASGLSASDPGWPLSLDRSRAYHDVLAEAGVAADPSLVREIAWGAEPAAAAMTDLLDRGATPTAVYAQSDELAFGALRTLRRRGLRVPEDVSVVGIDDHPMSGMVDLTTVHQSVRDQGELAGRMLLHALGRPGGIAESSVVTPTRLVVRGSTAPAAYS